MDCEVCRKPFTVELSFATLFSPPPMCPDCARRYVPAYSMEAIPYSVGLIDYWSVFEVANEDPIRERWLFRWMEKCFKLAIYKQFAYGLVLLIGEEEYSQARTWLPLLREFDRVLFLSLFYYDFSIYEDLV